MVRALKEQSNWLRKPGWLRQKREAREAKTLKNHAQKARPQWTRMVGKERVRVGGGGLEGGFVLLGSGLALTLVMPLGSSLDNPEAWVLRPEMVEAEGFPTQKRQGLRRGELGAKPHRETGHRVQNQGLRHLDRKRTSGAQTSGFPFHQWKPCGLPTS
jgi:hypothetical protein